MPISAEGQANADLFMQRALNDAEWRQRVGLYTDRGVVEQAILELNMDLAAVGGDLGRLVDAIVAVGDRWSQMDNVRLEITGGDGDEEEGGGGVT